MPADLQKLCPCGSGAILKNCCGAYIFGPEKAPTAEKLMRSRYTAYVLANAECLWQTTHPSQRRHHSKTALLDWAKTNHWIKLEILSAAETVVVFKAYFLDSALQPQIHHEKSRFVFENKEWYYLDGTYPAT